MKVIALANPQGGVGKSRTTWDLLVAFDDAGIPVAAIDYGVPGLLSAVNQARADAGHPTMPVFAAANLDQLKTVLVSLAKRKTTVVLIDTPSGGNEADLMAVLAPAHLLLIPTLPRPAEIAATASLTRPLWRAQRNFHFLLVRTASGGMVYDQAFLATLGMTLEEARKLLVPMSIADRPRLMDDLNKMGLGVLEAFGNAQIDQVSVGNASQEIRYIRQFLRDELDF